MTQDCEHTCYISARFFNFTRILDRRYGVVEFNAGKVLLRCIDSLLKFSHREFFYFGSFHVFTVC